MQSKEPIKRERVQKENTFGIPKDTRKAIFIGIDNGVSGAVTFIDEQEQCVFHGKTPVKKCLNYTKKKAFINRVDFSKLETVLLRSIDPSVTVFCMIERPMINPTRFAATVSAVRCVEATEILLEQLQIPYQFIDSREWQQKMLPSGLKGEELKLAAKDVSKRLYPKLDIVNADSLLIALYCKRKMLK